MAFKILLILLLTNMAPLLMVSLCPKLTRFFLLDNARRLADGQPLFGTHKTLCGFVGGLAAGGLSGYLIGVSLFPSLLIAFTSLLGDLLTSFLKRRFGFKEGENIYLFDHLFEGGIPLLLAKWIYALSLPATFSLLLVFIGCGTGGPWIVKKIFFLPANSPDSLRSVRSKASFREWRACHIALTPFARLLNFETFIYYRWLMEGLFRLLGVYAQGKKNALDVRLKTVRLELDGFPGAFSPYRILFISDLHLDGLSGLCRRIIDLVSDLNVDLCLLGGDYRMEMYGNFDEANRRLDRLVRHIRAADGIFGVLGNHDCLKIAPALEDSRICMLINDSVTIERDGQKLSIVGVDDPHYYQCQDLEKAFSEVPLNGFTILLSHSPEIVADIGQTKVDLCLCGHTHAGQIRLPLVGPVFTHSRASRKYVSGLWRHGNTIGYTSSGAGSSGVPVRFNCPPEVVLLTLTRAKKKA
jgi:predicted MPP superfamily phosphohydrolase